jgi:D-alanyl-lipoteichoic acid acyltransferase DltB (MBOAT superfamily)
MLFNSYIFILVFLPVTLLGFHFCGRFSNRALSTVWLVLASLFFYAWWNPNYLVLILASIIFNFAFARALLGQKSRLILALGVAGNLGLISYFKYTNFLVDSYGTVFNTEIELAPIILPLAISFFTFQQIAFLVDVYKQRLSKFSFLHYCLFISFFPQLIAGPIVQQREMLPQFIRARFGRLTGRNLAIGLTIFAIGLFKKVIIADEIAAYSSPVFAAAQDGQIISFVESWGAALAYTFQLYFDFSGYSDMAVGLARLFGLKLPINFFSPYKATSIIEFWRRWHMTLSRFLREFLYIPLGGNQRRVFSVMATMLLGGLWHGSGWTFVVWGGLHGLYLLVNHAWRSFFPVTAGLWGRWTGRLLTFVAVVLGWILFRAEDWGAATAMVSGMAGLHGFGPELDTLKISWTKAYPILAGLLVVVWVMPNTYQLMSRYHPALMGKKSPEDKLWKIVDRKWRISVPWAYAMSFIAIAALSMLTRISEFLYFQF